MRAGLPQRSLLPKVRQMTAPPFASGTNARCRIQADRAKNPRYIKRCRNVAVCERAEHGKNREISLSERPYERRNEFSHGLRFLHRKPLPMTSMGYAVEKLASQPIGIIAHCG